MKSLFFALVVLFFAVGGSSSQGQGRASEAALLPQEVVEVLSQWSQQLRRAGGTASFASAASREAFVVDKVEGGLWPAEV